MNKRVNLSGVSDEHQIIEDRLKTMLAQSQFAMYLQPIVSIQSQQTMGFEALARFQTQPYRQPLEWFDDTKKVGLEEALDQQLLEAGLKELARIPKSSYLSLNVMPSTCANGSVSKMLAGFPLDRIVLEITEHTQVHDYARIAAELQPLRESGLRIAIDDVGAGFSSFLHVLKIKPDFIKLDAALIRGIHADNEKCRFIESIVHFAKHTGYQIIAEGVECASELNTLRDLQVNKAQGYFVEQPKPGHSLN